MDLLYLHSKLFLKVKVGGWGEGLELQCGGAVLQDVTNFLASLPVRLGQQI